MPKVDVHVCPRKMCAQGRCVSKVDVCPIKVDVPKVDVCPM